jgi:hypothetical protein
MMVMTGLHCFCDVRWNSRKRKGFYTIKIWMYGVPAVFVKDNENKEKLMIWKTLWGLNGAWSTIWLMANFLISITILGAWLYYV